MAFLGANEMLVLEKNTGKVQHVVNGAIVGTAIDLAVNNNSELGVRHAGQHGVPRRQLNVGPGKEHRQGPTRCQWRDRWHSHRSRSEQQLRARGSSRRSAWRSSAPTKCWSWKRTPARSNTLSMARSLAQPSISQ